MLTLHSYDCLNSRLSVLLLLFAHIISLRHPEKSVEKTSSVFAVFYKNIKCRLPSKIYYLANLTYEHFYLLTFLYDVFP